jgi:hypothetical protein
VLEAEAERTTVGYHTYCRYPFPVTTSTPNIVDQAQRAMDDAFLRLKHVVQAEG